MTLSPLPTIGAQSLTGEIVEDATVEPSAEEAEALALTVNEEGVDWTYNASTEDNGVTGILDDEAGLLYNGPSGAFFRVSVQLLEVIDTVGTETTDLAAFTIFVNSVPVAYADEGLSEHFGEVVVDHNIDTIIGPLLEDDVVRFVMEFTGEETEADLDVAAAGFSIT